MDERKTYINRKHLDQIINDFNLQDFTAQEARLSAFMAWRDYFDLDYNNKINEHSTFIIDFDILSQVNMFDHDLKAMRP